MSRIDFHVKVLDDRVVARAKRRGLDALVYAPHFTRLPEIESRASAYSDDELVILPAREIFSGSWSDRRHVLAIGLEDPVPDFLPLGRTIDELQRQSAAVLVPHPAYLSVSLTATEIREYRNHLDAIEVYNPKHLSYHNRRARRLARENDLPAFGSSYAHLRGTVGEVWTEIDDRIESVESLQAMLKSGLDGRVHRRGGAGHLARRLAEFGHLGWENSGQKIDRVLLSGMEATHPRHPAYEGRFADDAVY